LTQNRATFKELALKRGEFAGFDGVLILLFFLTLIVFEAKV